MRAGGGAGTRADAGGSGQEGGGPGPGWPGPRRPAGDAAGAAGRKDAAAAGNAPPVTSLPPSAVAAAAAAAAAAARGGRRAGWKTRGGEGMIGENCLTSARSEDAGAVDDVDVAAVGSMDAPPSLRWQRRCALRRRTRAGAAAARGGRARGSCAASTRGGRALGGKHLHARGRKRWEGEEVTDLRPERGRQLHRRCHGRRHGCASLPRGVVLCGGGDIV